MDRNDLQVIARTRRRRHDGRTQTSTRGGTDGGIECGLDLFFFGVFILLSEEGFRSGTNDKATTVVGITLRKS